MQRIVVTFIMLLLLSGCATQKFESPGTIRGGYYNGYYNKNAVILYKRPSSKLGCWSSPCGWDCYRQS